MQLGRYRLHECLGEGRTSFVYRASCEGRDHDVALKVLKDEAVEQEGLRQRFLNEGRVLRGLRAAHIVEIYELVFDEEKERAYIAMELLHGKTLGQLVREEGALPEHLAAVVGLQLAQALVAVHGAGLLYRDLKPDNVFVLEENGVLTSRIKLLDFGTVKPLHVEADLKSTDPGTAVGTPYYMSPEQITDQEVDGRSDIYALGVVLFELLTGRVPFVAKSYGELMLQLVTDPPPRIESLREESIDGQLDALVRRCLEKDPKDRYPSALELAEALESIVDPAPPFEQEISGVIDVPKDTTQRPSPALGEVHTGQVRHMATQQRELRPQRDGNLGKLLVVLALLALIGIGAALYFFA